MQLRTRQASTCFGASEGLGFPKATYEWWQLGLLTAKHIVSLSLFVLQPGVELGPPGGIVISTPGSMPLALEIGVLAGLCLWIQF